jgi:hypothetical protein
MDEDGMQTRADLNAWLFDQGFAELGKPNILCAREPDGRGAPLKDYTYVRKHEDGTTSNTAADGKHLFIGRAAGSQWHVLTFPEGDDNGGWKPCVVRATFDNIKEAVLYMKVACR